MKGFFGGLFDLNNDGKLNSFERAMDLYAFNEMANHTNPRSGIISSYYGGSDEELEAAGLDRELLELLNDEERDEVLLDAGLDPNDYDFY